MENIRTILEVVGAIIAFVLGFLTRGKKDEGRSAKIH